MISFGPEGPGGKTDRRPAILVVDDAPANLVAICAVLDALGERLITARSGEEAVELAVKESVELIILDVMMPGLDGFQTAKLLQSREPSRHIPIVFVTATTREEADIVKAYAHGAIDYVVKPYEPRVLRAKVARFLQLMRERADERRSNQGLAHAQAERLRLIVDSVQDHAIFTLDAHGRIDSWSRGAERITRYRASEVIGQPISVFATDDVEARRSQELELAEAIDTGRAVVDGWRRRKDGTLFWAEGAVSAVKASDGTLAGFVKVMRDGTQIKRQAEQQRLDRERLRLTLDATRIGTWERDFVRGVDHWDSRCKELFGLAPDSPEPSKAEILHLIHPEDRARVRSALHAAQANRDGSSDGSYRVEYRVVSPTGPERWLLSLGRVYFANGKAERVLGTLLDITQRRERETRLEREATFRDQMVGILGHDLRNPLTAIKMGAQLMAKATNLEAIRAQAGRMSHSVARMEKLATDMLDLAATELGPGLPMSPREVDLGTSVARVVDELSTAHPDRTVRMESHGDLGGKWDPDRVEQVASNLIGNAIQRSAPELPIEVLVIGSPQEVALSVHNSGVPIPPDQMGSIFLPFVRGRDASSQRGTVGLGLFITQKIVEAHGGSVDVSSSPEGGTTFTVRLPRLPPLPADTRRASGAA